MAENRGLGRSRQTLGRRRVDPPPSRRPPGPGGEAAKTAGIPAEWGKFCADELAVAPSSSRHAAGRMQGLAYDLATRLPRTARALREGVIDAFKAQIIAEATRVLDDAGAAAAEALALPNVAGKNPGQIRAVIGRAVLKVDPDTARERRKQAEKDPRVELWREDAGTAALCGFHLPPDEALAADQMIAGQAEALKAAGLDGTMDQLRARAYFDILLGRDSRPAPEARDGTAGSADNPGSQAAGQDCQSDIGDVGDVGPSRRPPVGQPTARQPSAGQSPVGQSPAGTDPPAGTLNTWVIRVTGSRMGGRPYRLVMHGSPQMVRARLQHVLADTGALVRDGACSITPVAGEAPIGGRSRSRGPPARRRIDERRGGGGAQFVGTGCGRRGEEARAAVPQDVPGLPPPGAARLRWTGERNGACDG